jgi:hypothetical protein
MTIDVVKRERRPSLENEAEAETCHEGVDGECRPQKGPASGRSVLRYFRYDGLRVCRIEEINRRYQVPSLAESKIA